MTIMTAQNSILLAETSSTLTRIYAEALVKLKWPIRAVSSYAETIDLCRASRPAFLILDLGEQPRMDGLAALEILHGEGRLPPLIVMSGQASVNLAVKSMRLGARDFLIKPFTAERLLLAVQANLPVLDEEETMPAIVAGITPDTPAPAGFARQGHTGFIGTCQSMLHVYEQIEHAARSQATVFITGESGTGKEVCAEAVHALGKRAGKPFVPINCAAIPRDLMESELFGHVKGAFTSAIADREGSVSLAHGGTLFLDEVAEMAVDM
jgi:two-component system repressor protein LuxO